MMSDPLLSLTQAFQLMGLVQCALLLAYLGGCGGDVKRRWLAGAFFLVLAAGFGLPIWPDDWASWIPASLAAIGGALPALSYLLADQMLKARFPDRRQFAVLLLPLLGSPMLFMGALAPVSDACFEQLCIEADDTAQLWQVISGGLILLGIMALAELRLKEVLQHPQGRERRGLVLGLVIVNLAVLFALLANLFGVLQREESRFAVIALGLGFIYLATTMMFRIFPESSEFVRHRLAVGEVVAVPLPEPLMPAPEAAAMGGGDLELLERIRRYLAEEKPHLREDFHRQDMARELEVPEHRLSKVVNQGFGKSLIDVLNELRVEEAKHLLATTDQQITQIAFAAGFNALPSFHRVFKKLAGCSPSDWREREGAEAGKPSA